MEREALVQRWQAQLQRSPEAWRHHHVPFSFPSKVSSNERSTSAHNTTPNSAKTPAGFPSFTGRQSAGSSAGEDADIDSDIGGVYANKSMLHPTETFDDQSSGQRGDDGGGDEPAIDQKYLSGMFGDDEMGQEWDDRELEDSLDNSTPVENEDESLAVAVNAPANASRKPKIKALERLLPRRVEVDCDTPVGTPQKQDATGGLDLGGLSPFILGRSFGAKSAGALTPASTKADEEYLWQQAAVGQRPQDTNANSATSVPKQEPSAPNSFSSRESVGPLDQSDDSLEALPHDEPQLGENEPPTLGSFEVVGTEQSSLLRALQNEIASLKKAHEAETRALRSQLEELQGTVRLLSPAHSPAKQASRGGSGDLPPSTNLHGLTEDAPLQTNSTSQHSRRGGADVRSPVTAPSQQQSALSPDTSSSTTDRVASSLVTSRSPKSTKLEPVLAATPTQYSVIAGDVVASPTTGTRSSTYHNKTEDDETAQDEWSAIASGAAASGEDEDPDLSEFVDSDVKSQVFKLADENGDGTINPQEMRKLLKRFKVNCWYCFSIRESLAPMISSLVFCFCYNRRAGTLTWRRQLHGSTTWLRTAMM